YLDGLRPSRQRLLGSWEIDVQMATQHWTLLWAAARSDFQHSARVVRGDDAVHCSILPPQWAP
ncbi:MAG: hypothetical protein ACE5EF_04565, partial [Dehalococcoidia bacterium]